MDDTIIFLNSRGFQNEIKAKVNKLANDHKPIALLVAEHFQSTTTHLQLDGYVLAAHYCRFARERGGVAIFVRADVDFVPRADLDVFNVKKEFEVRSVEIPSRNAVVTVVYRPPSGGLRRFYVNLENLLKTYKQTPYLKHVMGGDFNIDNGKCNRAEQILAKYNFNFTNTAQTHELGRCLDNFVVDFVPSTTRVMSEKLSDHNCIKLILLGGSSDRKLQEVVPWSNPLQPRIDLADPTLGKFNHAPQNYPMGLQCFSFLDIHGVCWMCWIYCPIPQVYANNYVHAPYT